MRLLEVKDVTMRFGGLLAINGVSAYASENEIVGIIGPNGAGKTTLFNVLTGIYQPTSGSVSFCGTDFAGKKPHEIARLGIARTFQNIRLFDSMSVFDNVLVGMHGRTSSGALGAVLRMCGCEERAAAEKALRLLEMTGLSDFRYDLAVSLPYGHQRKVEIARAMAAEPKLLLLDEPAAGMNERETADLTDFIRQVRAMGYSMILIEHDVRLVMSLCDRIYVLDHGSLIAEGTPFDIQHNSAVIDAYLGKGEG